MALRIGADVRNSDLAAHPIVRSRYPVLARALLSGASGQLRNLATTGGQPAATHPVRLLPGRHHALQQAHPGHRLLGHRRLRPLPRHPRRLRALRRRSSLGHGGRHGRARRRRSSTSTPTANTACRSTISTGCPVTGPTATPTCPGRAHHRRRDSAAARRRALDLPQGPRPRLLRVRADLGGRRTGHRGRHRSPRPGSPSAASRTNRGVPTAPNRRCVGQPRPRTRSGGRRRRTAQAKPLAGNEFKVELTRAHDRRHAEPRRGRTQR